MKKQRLEKKQQIEEQDIIDCVIKCRDILNDKKARDVLLMDLKKINTYLDYFVIGTGNSFLHCKALAKEMQRFFKESGFQERTKSRLDSGWIALDYNEIVVHIFTQEMRNYYQLEKLWADAGLID